MKDKFFIRLLSLLIAVTVMCFACAFTVFAEGEDEPAGQIIADDGQQYTPEIIPDSDPEEQPEDQQVPEEQPEETVEEQYDPIYEYFYSVPEEATSVYEEPQYLNELPEVTASEVVQPTAVAIPEVAVSDASMLSGIVMWLCVALGIAVIVGVLVSKRTRSRGV